jgi:hypothetical protein
MCICWKTMFRVLTLALTTEPIRRRIGSVVRANVNKRAKQGSIPGSERFHPGEHRTT